MNGEDADALRDAEAARDAAAAEAAGLRAALRSVVLAHARGSFPLDHPGYSDMHALRHTIADAARALHHPSPVQPALAWGIVAAARAAVGAAAIRWVAARDAWDAAGVEGTSDQEQEAHRVMDAAEAALVHATRALTKADRAVTGGGPYA